MDSRELKFGVLVSNNWVFKDKVSLLRLYKIMTGENIPVFNNRFFNGYQELVTINKDNELEYFCIIQSNSKYFMLNDDYKIKRDNCREMHDIKFPKFRRHQTIFLKQLGPNIPLVIKNIKIESLTYMYGLEEDNTDTLWPEEMIGKL